MKSHRALRWTVTIACILFTHSECQAISIGVPDTFAVDLQGWGQGHASVPPSTVGATRATSGGPDGGADPFLRIQTDAGGSNGKMVVFNHTQWAGDYVGAKVSSISMAANNIGATDLKLRVALGTGTSGRTGAWFASTNSITLPAGSGWTNLQFPVDAASMSSAFGAATYAAVMGGVVTLRILDSGNTPGSQGLNMVATLGLDNIVAISVPGDYNNNGTVDATDYVAWRDNVGVPVTLPNDITPGTVTTADYDVWKANFGKTFGSGAAATIVPEPAAWWWMIVSTVLCRPRRK